MREKEMGGERKGRETLKGPNQHKQFADGK